ncbi:MAG: MFS transporter [Lewinellaceae bacterium]|nr:MFS transporter [Lewinellaceae bacterium]
MESTTAAVTIPPVSRTSTILAGIAGNVLEWYDFAVYGFFAPVFAELFFPSKDPTVSLIASFGAFAAGFLMRPVGGAFFGYIGDHIGRKRALNLSVMMMAVPTFLIGLMPTYGQVGVAASVALVLLRMAQGLSVGGEYTSSIVYLVESAPKSKRGLFSSASLVGATGGILLGSFVGSIISGMLDESQLHTWGWRLPFLFGVLVAGVGFLIRRHMPETLKEEEKADNPLKHLWEDRKEVLRVSALNLLTAIAFYAIFIFAATWLVNYVKEPRTVALQLNTMSMIVLMIAVPFFAWLSDRVGRKPVLIGGAVGMVVFAYPLVWLMHHHNDAMILGGQMGMAILLAAYAGTIPATLTEMFSSKVRVTAVSVGYNLTYAIFGGTTPMVAVWLIEKEHNDMAFAWYIVVAAAVSLVAAIWIRDGAHKPLPN